MVLKDIALLAADTTRSRAYLHAMIQEDMLPEVCIVYSDDISKTQNNAGGTIKIGVTMNILIVMFPW